MDELPGIRFHMEESAQPVKPSDSPAVTFTLILELNVPGKRSVLMRDVSFAAAPVPGDGIDIEVLGSPRNTFIEGRYFDSGGNLFAYCDVVEWDDPGIVESLVADGWALTSQTSNQRKSRAKTPRSG